MSQHGIFCKASFCLPRLTLHLDTYLLRTTLGTSMAIDDWDVILCHFVIYCHVETFFLHMCVSSCTLPGIAMNCLVNGGVF